MRAFIVPERVFDRLPPLPHSMKTDDQLDLQALHRVRSRWSANERL
jgi:hypothetical protein